MAQDETIRLPRALAILLGVLAGALALLAAACGEGEGETGIIVGDSGPIIDGQPWPYRGAAMSRETEMPDMVLTATDGREFDLRADTEGFATLLYVGYTNCPDFCPTHMAMIARALDQLPAEATANVRVVFITSDPDRDTPAVLREWLDFFDTTFIGLTGSPDELVDVQRALGMNPAEAEPHAEGHDDYAVNHASFVLAFPPGTRIALAAYPPGATADDFAADLSLLIWGRR